MIASDWFPGLLAVCDAIITVALFYCSGTAGIEAYVAYFFIILIALLTRTWKQTLIYSSLVTTMYGLTLVQDLTRTGFTLDAHFMQSLVQLPLILAMAIACGRAMESVSVLVSSDPITGLPSRRQFAHLVYRALLHARKSHEKISVLVLDIAGMDDLHSTNGATASHSALKHVVSRLVPLLKQGDVMARQGPTSFTFLLKNFTTPKDVANLADEVVDALRIPLIVSGKPVALTGCLGGELVQDTFHARPSSIIENAKSALVCAKTRGKNCYEFYTKDMTSRSFDPLYLEVSLRNAIDRGELAVSYQPKIDLSTGHIAGTEALMRWQHQDLGALSPLLFIPLAEGSGLIEPMGEWILRAACLQIGEWKKNGFPPVHMGVNVSPKQLRHPGMVAGTSRILNETKLDPKCLELEITESVLIGETDAALDTLHQLKSLGIRLSVDDFGTGFSGLSYLSQMPIDALKIDQKFVREINQGHQAKTIIKGIVGMARSLGLKITAEGVENEEQALFLRDLGCHEGQGYLYSKPLTSAAMGHYLQAEQTRQRIDATKNAFIDALAGRYNKIAS